MALDEQLFSVFEDGGKKKKLCCVTWLIAGSSNTDTVGSSRWVEGWPD